MPFVRHTDVADGGNGAATNAHDFIVSKLVPFITSATHFPVLGDRWILERTDAVATNEVEIFISPPTNVTDAPAIAWHTRDSASYMFAGTSYVAGTEAYALPGNTRQHPQDSGGSPDWANVTNDRHLCSWTNIWPTTGLLAHWLFAPPDGSYCIAIIQLETRRFRNITFGVYDKFSAAMAGGAFFGAQHWNQGGAEIDDPFNASRIHSGVYVAARTSLGSSRQCAAFRAEGLRTGGSQPNAEWFLNDGFFNPQTISRPTGVGSPPWDTQNNAALDVGKGWMNALGTTGPGSSFLYHVQQSLISNIKPLLPITVWAQGFAEGQNRFMPVGQLPDVFRVHGQGFTPAQDLVVGSDTYSLFPIINSDQVNTLSNEEYSAFDTLAIRQRP